MGKKSGDEGSKWFAVRVRPQQRQIMGKDYVSNPADAPFFVEHLLKQRGVETYAPRKKVFRFVNKVGKQKRQKVEKAFPAFPGWLFAQVNESQWRDLLGCPGVSGVAGANGRPTPISEAALRQLAKRLGDGMLTAPERERYMRTYKEYAPGQIVRIADGSLTDLTVKVVKVEGRMAKVLLPLFGQEREVEIDAMLLEAA